jgi:hypothetical protein
MNLKTACGDVYITFEYSGRICSAKVEFQGQHRTNVEGVGYGVSRCHPEDRFVKSKARQYALKRAIDNLPRSTRAAIWHAYRNRPGVSRPKN